MNDGYILLHRKIIDWRWYSNKNDRILFIHCLLSANWKDGWFKGIKISRGSYVTSLQNLSKECGLTMQQTRTSINHLKSTNEITYESTNQFSIITINKYNEYQLDNKQNNNQITNEQQTNNNNRIKEINKLNNNNNMNIIIYNWEKKLKCEAINKTNNTKCCRRSSYEINGKNYCNQHSREVIKEILKYKNNLDNNKLPEWFDKEIEINNEKENEIEDLLKEFI